VLCYYVPILTSISFQIFTQLLLCHRQYNSRFSQIFKTGVSFIGSHKTLNLICTTCKLFQILLGCADKSLAWHTSQCHKMESIVSLERGVYSCAELKSFLVTEAERKHVRWRVQFQQHRDVNCHQVPPPAKKGTKGNSCHSERNIRGTCIIICRQKLGGPV
jgi:hypothetical protein